MKVFSQLESAQIENVVADPTPTATTVGRVIYRTDTDEYKFCDSTPAWRTLFASLDGTLSFTGLAVTPGSLPVAGDYKLYFKTDGNPYLVNSAGVEKIFLTGAGDDTIPYTDRSTLPATPAAGTFKTYFRDGQPYFIDENGIEQPLGSGSGTGRNYVLNPDLEVGLDDISTYKDAAQAIPEDGTGGAPTITATRNLVAPLRGDASLVITKPASNVQGEGVRLDLENFDNADLGRVLILSIDNDLSDANYVDGDLRVYFLDNTNSNVIRMNGEDMIGGKGSHMARVQIPIDCLSGSILIHYATTNALAQTLKIDSFVFGPQKISQGSIIADWVTYTPVTSSFGTISSEHFYYRRVGDSIEVSGKFTSGTIAGTEAQVGLPPGLTVVSNITTVKVAGTWFRGGSNTSSGGSMLITGGDSFVNFSASAIFSGVAGNPLAIANGNGMIGSGQQIAFIATIPIQGWSSQSQSSEDFGGRDVIVQGRGNGGGFKTANSTDIDFVNTLDLSSSWDGQVFTAPEKGTYSFEGNTYWSTNTARRIMAWVNGSEYILVGDDTATSFSKFSGSIPLEKDDTLSFRTKTSGTVLNNNINHWIHIQKLGSSQQILETEIVAARYTSNSGQLISGTLANIEYEDIDFDTHNSYNISNGEYTIPVTGKYHIKGSFGINANDQEQISIQIVVDGAAITFLRQNSARNSANYYIQVIENLDLLKGQKVTIQGATSGGSTALLATGNANSFSIARIK